MDGSPRSVLGSALGLDSRKGETEGESGRGTHAGVVFLLNQTDRKWFSRRTETPFWAAGSQVALLRDWLGAWVKGRSPGCQSWLSSPSTTGHTDTRQWFMAHMSLCSLSISAKQRCQISVSEHSVSDKKVAWNLSTKHTKSHHCFFFCALKCWIQNKESSLITYTLFRRTFFYFHFLGAIFQKTFFNDAKCNRVTSSCKKPYDLAAIIIEIKKATVVIFSAGLCIMKFALNIHQVLERQFL